MEIIGYKYYTEQEAIEARKSCADYYGLPISSDAETIYYVNYQTANYDNPVFWYITYYQGTESVLGEPYQFDITIPALPTF